MLKNKKYGIKDIARLANVSIGTIDRVLHKRGRVSELTRQKVEKIIKQLNYKPNIMARTLVINKRYSIYLFIPNPQGNEFWERAYEGIQEFITKFEHLGIYFIFNYYSTENKKSFEEVGHKILESLPDGIIMTPLFLNEGINFYKQCCDLSIPVIMFNTTIPYSYPPNYIGIDDYQSGRVVAELFHLTSPKNFKYAILHLDEELENAPHMIERERGFISYFKEVCPDKEYIIRVLNNKEHKYEKELTEIMIKDKIRCIFVSTTKVYRVGLFIKQKKITGTMLIGYDLINKNVQLLKEGYIKFLINENPRLQIQQSINALSNHLIYGELIKSNHVFPIEIITRTNVYSNQNIPSNTIQKIETV